MGMSDVRRIFLAGIPASGKSHFGAWLEATHGFVHIDAEIVGGKLDQLGLHGVWDSSLTAENCSAFVEAAQALGSAIVLNWGFPTRHLPFVRTLKGSGFAMWWFDGSVPKARAEYLRLGKAERDFDMQVAAIEIARREIDAVFAP